MHLRMRLLLWNMSNFFIFLDDESTLLFSEAPENRKILVLSCDTVTYIRRTLQQFINDKLSDAYFIIRCPISSALFEVVRQRPK